ncbi:MAG: PKD domain-containing protein [Nannocystaceae bacterium]
MVLTAAPQAHAGNFPPVAQASASGLEVLVGEVVQFDGSASFDPDDGPGALGFTWDFGDGATATEVAPTHAFDSLGLHSVTLAVDDGLATTLAFVDVVVVAPPTATPPRHSGPIALAPDESRLAVANTDAGTVALVSLPEGDVTEIAVGAAPRTVAFTDDGATVWVACAGDRRLWRVDVAAAQAAADVALPAAPAAALALADGRVLATLPAVAALQAIGGDGPETVALAGEPHAIAVDAAGTRAWVTHFLTRGEAGTVSVVDLASMARVAEVALPEDPGPDTASSGRGFPNLLHTAAITPAGDAVWIGGLKSNTSRGSFVDGNPLTPRNRVRGAMFRVDPLGDVEDGLRRLDTNDADSVAAIGFSPRGRYAYLVHQGAGRLSVYDLPKAATVMPGDGSTASFETRIDLGHAPNGIVVSADGSRAYVRNELSRDVAVIDLSVPAQASVLTSIVVAGETLSPELLLGKQMFHRSRAPEHADQNYIACASCHPDGGSDGRTWDFTQAGEGLRNTVDLRGRGGTDHGPVHWSANFDEIQDFENDIVNAFGGSGLAHDGLPPNPPLDPAPNAGRSAELDALAAWVGALTVAPRSPFREPDGSLGEAALRGKALFFDETVACASCHVPPRFTDSSLDADPFVLHDVGTLLPSSGGRLGGVLEGIDTPTVVGVWASPPYLHDGRAADLRAVLTEHNRGDRHGVTSQLSPEDIDDLVAFLRALQGDADELPAPPPGDDTTGGGSSDGGGSTTAADGGTSTDTTAGSSGDAGATAGDDSHGGCGCHTRARAPAWTLLLLGLALPCVRRTRRRS